MFPDPRTAKLAEFMRAYKSGDEATFKTMLPAMNTMFEEEMARCTDRVRDLRIVKPLPHEKTQEMLQAIQMLADWFGSRTSTTQ